MMNKLLVLITLIIATITPWSALAQVRLGLTGGLNLAKLRYEPRDEFAGSPDENTRASYRIGGIIDIAMSSPFAVQTGVLIMGKGGKSQFGSSSGGYTRTMSPAYLEIPADVLFKPNITRGLRLYMGLGPYVAFGIGGKSKYTGNVPAGSFTDNHRLHFGKQADDDMKKRDIGGNALAGFEFNSGFLLGVSYGLSFTNNAPSENLNGPRILRNKVFGISMGYLFTSYRKWPRHRNYYYY